MGSLFGSPAGSRALDLMNTLDWRDDPARRCELLTDAQAFRAWTVHVGFPATVTRGIRHDRQRTRAIQLRETLALIFGAVVRGASPPRKALALLTRWTQSAWRHRRMVLERGALAWRWRPDTDAADRVLFEIALDAGELLLSPDRHRIGLCAGAGCGWLFVDRSKGGKRRWCSMASCGNRLKVRQYRERKSHD
jgi:predicted RNA-binding Zn ribbon-like protein